MVMRKFLAAILIFSALLMASAVNAKPKSQREVIQMVNKAVKEYFDDDKEYVNPYEEDPTDIRAICFSANGDILGSNVYKQDINEILSFYNPQGITMNTD